MFQCHTLCVRRISDLHSSHAPYEKVIRVVFWKVVWVVLIRIHHIKIFWGITIGVDLKEWVQVLGVDRKVGVKLLELTWKCREKLLKCTKMWEGGQNSKQTFVPLSLMFHCIFSASMLNIQLFLYIFQKGGQKDIVLPPTPSTTLPVPTPLHVMSLWETGTVLFCEACLIYSIFHSMCFLFFCFCFFLRSDVLQPTMCKLQRSCTFFVFLRNLQCPFFRSS